MATRTRPPRKRRQYLVDERGRATAVVLPIKLYEELVEAAEQREDIRHLEAGRKVKGRPLPWAQVKAKLRAEGKLP